MAGRLAVVTAVPCASSSEASCALALARVATAAVTAASNEVGSSRASTWPLLTRWPARATTFDTCPQRRRTGPDDLLR